MKKEETTSKKKLSRRDFLKGTAAAGATAMMASLMGCSTTDNSTSAGENTTTDENMTAAPETTASIVPEAAVWDYETDVIVAGSGGGLLAACDAADAGNEVILVEKAFFLGGECIMNEGWINGAGTSVQAAENVTDNAETFALDWSINHSATAPYEDQNLVNTYIQNSGAAIDRLIELGCEYKLAQDVQYYGSAARAHIIQPNASAWATVLQKAAEDRGVTIMTETPLTNLLVDENGEVIGIASNNIRIRARKGVILATGDASGSQRMKAKFQPESAHISACCPNNTADGYYAALRIGADSSHRQFTSVGPCQMFYPEGSALNSYAIGKGLIIVNKDGKRYASEMDYSGCALGQANQPDQKAYAIFDSQVAAISHRPDCPAGEILGRFFAGECTAIGLISGIGPAYLEDCIANGTVVEAETLEELAKMLDIDYAGLSEQINTWNSAVASGVDTEWNRPMMDDFQFGAMTPIEQGPFYGLIFKEPQWMLTEGPNLLVDTNMNILDREGNPIPRLYGAGAGLCGGTGTLTLNTCGDHMGFTAVSARIAAANVSALSARS